MSFSSTKIIELGSCAFRQPRASHSHCQFLHGYRLQAKFWFECSELDIHNWVVDFGDLKDLKAVLQKQFDHTLCIAGDDPLLEHFEKLHTLGGCDLRVMRKGVGIERTAEWCFEAANALVRQKTSGRCWCTKVEVWEHEQNSAIYTDSKSQLDCLSKIEEKNIPKAKEAVTTQQDSQPVRPQPQGALVGNRVSSGWSDPFAGTSWGSTKPPTSIG